MLLPLGLPFTVYAWRRGNDFVAHHGRQATLGIGAVFVLAGVHAILHLMAHGVLALAAWAETQGGTVPEWTVAALPWLLAINRWAFVGELVIACVLAIHQSRGARRGDRTEYFFSQAL